MDVPLKRTSCFSNSHLFLSTNQKLSKNVSIHIKVFVSMPNTLNNVEILVLYHTIKAITIIAFSKDAIKLGQHLVLMMLLQLHKLPTKSFSERQLGSLLDAVACRRYLDFYNLNKRNIISRNKHILSTSREFVKVTT